MKRECGNCTRCCEGWISGEVKGKKFFNGSPCHYVNINKGCTIYNDRPKMCHNFNCEWLINSDIPEYLKPEKSKVLIKPTSEKNIFYWNVVECGQKIDSVYLNWIIQHCINNKINLKYEVNGGHYYLGDTDFMQKISEPEIEVLDKIQ